jgi:tetratricopeptide (TPR) repeat protein
MSPTPAVLPETNTCSKRRKLQYAAAVTLLLLVFVVELIVPAWRQSAAFDEGCHTLAGYGYWTRADFGVNPEHPPAVKLLATLPLLGQSLRFPSPGPIPFFKLSCFMEGRDFLFSNSASPDSILFRARMAAATLALLAAILTFAVAYEMFGQMAGLIALLLFVFDPNLIAHGALVTTDMGMTLFLTASVYAFYRYVKNPSIRRLAVTGVAVGLALASKHSAILVLPVLVLLAITEVVRHEPLPRLSQGGRLKHGLRLAVSLLAVSVISIAILWSFYGFRFAARPHGQIISPPFSDYVRRVPHPAAGEVISSLARYHLFPESYLYGVADLFIATNHFTSYLFGKLYRHGQRFYFPAVFVIKSTLGFLLLLMLLPLALIFGKSVKWRELLFLLLPPAAYFAAAINSGFNIGVRHILPIYPFLIVLAAFVVWQLGRLRKAWMYTVSGLLICHVLSSAHAFPNYLPYSNEIWGGPSQTYKVLTDSSVDWGQQLKETKTYLDKRNIRDCWFDYSGSLVASPDYYHIPCKVLLLGSRFSRNRGSPFAVSVVPAHISGTVLVSATVLADAGPTGLNPYEPFLHLRPDDEIGDGVLVFRGEFDVPLLSAVSHTQAASTLLANGKPDQEQLRQALAEAQSAVSLAPNDVRSQGVLGDALMKLNRKDEARAAYQRALTLAQTIHPEFQSDTISELKNKLQ